MSTLSIIGVILYIAIGTATSLLFENNGDGKWLIVFCFLAGIFWPIFWTFCFFYGLYLGIQKVRKG